MLFPFDHVSHSFHMLIHSILQLNILRSLSISWKRPNTLEHSDYMLECALSLQADSQYATDEFLLHLIQLQQLAEEVDKTFAGNIADMPSDLLALQLQTNVKRFQTRLNTWRASIPFHLEKSGKTLYNVFE